MSTIRANNLETLEGFVREVASLVSYPTPEKYGAIGDGLTDDTNAISQAVEEANTSGTKVFWSPKQYLAEGNIPNFFDVGHIGSGSILRESEEWKITMGVFDENKIFVSPGADGNNDGLSPSYPVTPLTAYNRFRAIEHPSSSGKYALIFLDGTYTDRGIRTSRMPYVSQALSIRAKNITTPPSVIWDGTGNAEDYAIRGDANSAIQYVEVEGLSLTNWFGGIVFDGNADINISNMSFSSITDSAVWIRQGRGLVTQSQFTNIGNAGVRNQYSARVNVTYCDFDNVGRHGVQYGRVSAGHVRYCDFANMPNACIDTTMNSRVRTIENNFNSFGVAAISTGSGSTWSNSTSEADTFNGISGESVAVSVGGNTSTPHLSLGSGNLLSRSKSSAGAGTNITEPGTRQNIIPLVDGLSLRVPGYLLFNPNARIVIEIDFSVGGGEALFELTGEGSSSSLTMASATVSFPDLSIGTIKLQTSGANESDTTARWCSQVVTDQGIIADNGSYNIDSALIRRKDPQVLLPRLYVTRVGSGALVLRQIFIYVYEG